MSAWRGSEGELLVRMLEYRTAGPDDVTISGDALADLLCELLSLAQTSDDLLDNVRDWQARAEAWAAQAGYLSHLVEHHQRILTYVNGESDDPDAAAMRIEADNLILFSPDTLGAIADAMSVVTAEPDDS